ncbi:MAG: DUF2970 domain-containing protein [Burkholderiales bacterium]|nr:DUF2970 domain-containing protein [Burkholderiales bacterium]MDE1927843.1 DUF2970 domain-containing protein [Burkholderiales bacterium]MDE2158897.1 DUF2970 domain-containing protein [Burkholderiales bacterium]MDE2503316.1 DUF2970 domain-containing protein [Burkholderiales bacterium]
MNDGTHEPAGRKGSLLHSLRAVAWSFLGIRKRSGYAEDMTRLNPATVIIAGVIGALIFIGLLIALVHWVVSSGVAAR